MNMHHRVKDGLVICAIALFGLLLYATFESYEYEQFTGEGDEARNNKYLAMQKHLADYDTEVDIISNTAALFTQASFTPVLPSSNDVIVLTAFELQVSQTQVERILTWVEQGGDLVIGLTNEADYTVLEEDDSQELPENSAMRLKPNYLLNALGVSRKSFDRTLLADVEDYDSEYNIPTLVDTQSFGQIEVNTEDSFFIDVKDSQNIIFSASVLPSMYNKYPTIVQIAMGEGVVTIMTDVEVWNNNQINHDDNIFFLHDLVQGRNKAYVFLKGDAKMWPSLIAQYSPSFYWILLCVVLLTVWFYAVRFGAIKHVNDTVVSYFSQHIRAAGQFYWMNNQKEKLLQQVRQALLEDMASKGIHGKVSDAHYVEVLVSMSGWQKEKIQLYVFDRNKINEVQFTKIIQGLQQLREMIWKN